MAKKAKKAKPKQKAKPAKKAAASKARNRKPRSQTLPGMEQVRHRDLDRFCESIGETRDSINELKGEEADLCRGALRSMRLHEVMSYRHAGVELVRVIGEDKLRVRTTEDEATAGAGVEETDDAPPETEAAGGSTEDGSGAEAPADE